MKKKPKSPSSKKRPEEFATGGLSQPGGKRSVDFSFGRSLGISEDDEESYDNEVEPPLSNNRNEPIHEDHTE